MLTQYEADSLFDLEPIARRFVDRDPAEDAGWTAMVHSELEDFEGLSPLPVSFLLAFGLLYLLLIGPVDYFVLRRIGRPGLTWVTFPVVALVFSGVAVITVSLGRTGGSEMSCIEVVEELSGTELARGSVWCSLWSSGRDDVSFAVPDADGWFGPGGSDLEHGWEQGTYEDVPPAYGRAQRGDGAADRSVVALTIPGGVAGSRGTRRGNHRGWAAPQRDRGGVPESLVRARQHLLAPGVGGRQRDGFNAEAGGRDLASRGPRSMEPRPVPDYSRPPRDCRRPHRPRDRARLAGGLGTGGAPPPRCPAKYHSVPRHAASAAFR